MPISHPSQIDRLPPPPLFQSSDIHSETVRMAIKILIENANFPIPPPFPLPFLVNQKSILQTVPEAENERPEVPPRMSNTRF
jgi:hypothetical protein